MVPKYYKMEQRDLRRPGHSRETYRVLHERCISGEEFINHIARHTAFDEAVLTGVLIEVAKELGELLATGQSVTLPGIGNFSIGVRAKVKREEEEAHELNAQNIEFDHINFRCSKKLRQDVAGRCLRSGFERVMGQDGVKIRKPAMLIKGRLAGARHYLSIHHVMRIQEYADAMGMSYSAAQRELKAAANDPNSGIEAYGRGNQRVYILARPKPEESEPAESQNPTPPSV